jgi:hypothetical protein
VIAMKGKECVVIACDMRYGIRNQTVAMNFPKVFRINSRVRNWRENLFCSGRLEDGEKLEEANLK